MLIAITGAAGFIGRHLARALIQDGMRLRLLLHRSDIDLEGEKCPGSLSDEPSLQRFLQGADLLFHLASALGGRALRRRDFFAVNSLGTRNLMTAALAAGVKKVVHFSSAGVYGKSSGLAPLKEADPANPRDGYERSKLEGEKTVLSFAAMIDVSVIRPGWVYGEGDPRTFKLIRRIRKGPFFIAGRGRARHAVIHVSDVVRLARLVAERGGRGEVYNSGGENLPVAEITAAIAAALGKPGRFLKIPSALILPFAQAARAVFPLLGREPPLTPAMLAFFRRGKPLDGAKAFAELGFLPQVRFAEGLPAAVDWYRRHGWL